jgi:hypothetical protein
MNESRVFQWILNIVTDPHDDNMSFGDTFLFFQLILIFMFITMSLFETCFAFVTKLDQCL